jgi:predicted RNA methylase
VSATNPVDLKTRQGVWQRISDGVCQRAFSSPEALLYEVTIASALARVVVPIVAARIRGESILEVGCGGGRIDLAIARTSFSILVGVDPSLSQVRATSRG